MEGEKATAVHLKEIHAFPSNNSNISATVPLSAKNGKACNTTSTYAEKKKMTCLQVRVILLLGDNNNITCTYQPPLMHNHNKRWMLLHSLCSCTAPQKFSTEIEGRMVHFFQKFGLWVARNPWK